MPRKGPDQFEPPQRSAYKFDMSHHCCYAETHAAGPAGDLSVGCSHKYAIGVLQSCFKALKRLRPGQKVGCLPGASALSNKAALVVSLTAAYGEGAFHITPRSYLLPSQYWQWRAWLQTQV